MSEIKDITIGELLSKTYIPSVPDGFIRWLPNEEVYNSKAEYEKAVEKEERDWQEFIKQFNGLIV